MKYLIYIMSIFLLISCSSTDKIKEPNNVVPKNLSIVGISNEIKNNDWKDNRVGMGLNAMLSELFYETNSFNLIEEKKEIKKAIKNISDEAWKLNQVGYKFDKKLEEINNMESEYIAYGKIYYFGKPRSKTNIGPVHVSKNSILIKVEVTLRNVKTGKKIIGKGVGVSTTTANSAMFTYRENNVELDKTNVGNATNKALAEAISNLMEKYKK